MALRLRHTALAWLAALLLGGCATTVRLDNEVRSYASWERSDGSAGYRLPAPGEHYHFERRPSQDEPSRARGQAMLEAMAQAALERVGLYTTPEGQVEAVKPRWSVEVSARSVRMDHAPWEQDPWPGFGLVGRGPYVGARGTLMLAPLQMHFQTPYYQREVSLTIRDLGSQRVVYETQAAHDGPWPNSPAMWSALLEAALEGFPIPRAGTRRVPLSLPR